MARTPSCTVNSRYQLVQFKVDSLNSHIQSSHYIRSSSLFHGSVIDANLQKALYHTPSGPVTHWHETGWTCLPGIIRIYDNDMKPHAEQFPGV